MATKTRRLPGIRFDVQPPLLDEALPRMDIAAFVGFTASGPLHTAVPVENPAQFGAIFGDDLPLAWDPAHGETAYAYLAPAVRAFFRNGGLRCWVVRVADAAKIVTNRFPIPGLAGVRDGAVSDAEACARSPGSWSDGLRVGAAVHSQPLETAELVSTSPLVVDLAVGISHRPAPGDLLHMSYAGSRAKQYAVVASTSDRAAPAGSDDARTRVRVTCGDSITLGSGPTGAISACECLTFDLTVRHPDGAITRLAGLGFAPSHPRFWGALPTDEQLYRKPDVYRAQEHAELWREASNPRFPLAGPPAVDTTAFYIPRDMPPVVETYAEAVTLREEDNGFDRDGLGTFDHRLFLDDRLGEFGAADLLTQADYLRYQSNSPVHFTGIYAALDVEEATLIAVPDAVHRGWKPASQAVVIPPSPPKPLARTEWWHHLDCNPPSDIPLATTPPTGNFLDCSIRVIPPPRLTTTPSDAKGRFTLEWPPLEAEPGEPGARFILEEATQPNWSDTAVIYEGNDRRWTVHGRDVGVYYYRLRVVIGGNTSDWSKPRSVFVPPASGLELEDIADYTDATLLATQRALLRLCGARGDLFAALSLPEHYRAPDAERHIAKLKLTPEQALAPTPTPAPTPTGITVKPLGYGEATAFSHGALYHPWLIGREEGTPGQYRRTPPDGAVCGIFARRALARGAWVAPANEIFHGVFALAPEMPRVAWQALQDAQLNVIRLDPRGVLSLSADTLSDDPDLRPINVRRLLILLRRLAIRVGMRYVFEPNSDAFRRTVERSFESLLARMYTRGAFAGQTAKGAYQVVTSSSLNTPQSVEQGRLIVELRVAPSQPLTFLTVKLAQSNGRMFVSEGR